MDILWSTPISRVMNFLGAVFEETDKTDDGPPADGHSTEGDQRPADGNQDPEEDPDGDGQTDPETDSIRSNADRKIGTMARDLRATDIALIDSIARNPAKAGEIINDLRQENPELANRLANLYLKEGESALSDKLKDASPEVRAAFEDLSAKTREAQETAQKAVEANERRLYEDWRAERAPFLKPDSKEMQTPLGKKLVATLAEVVDEFFPPSKGSLNTTMLEEALVIAKRRVGWKDSKVREALETQAKEQAARQRSSSTPRGGEPVKQDGKLTTDPKIAQEFGHGDPDRMKKVDEAKRRAGFIR